MTKPSDSVPLRRSPRVHVRIPVILSGTLPDGKTFSEEAFVLTVSKYGGKLKSLQPLKAGARVRIKPRNGKASDLVRVAWVGHEGSPRAGEIGIEYVKLSNILGVVFPE